MRKRNLLCATRQEQAIDSARRKNLNLSRLLRRVIECVGLKISARVQKIIFVLAAIRARAASGMNRRTSFALYAYAEKAKQLAKILLDKFCLDDVEPAWNRFV